MKQLLKRCRTDAEFLVELSPLWWRDRSVPTEQVLQMFFDAGFFAYRVENDYRPWRCLWPAAVKTPRRVRGPIDSSIEQIDLVLSRVDADELGLPSGTSSLTG
jgi:hypothetical protein